MGVTISTHNGSAASREHNVRNPKVVSKEPHIDMLGSHEVWVDEPIRKAYDRLFGEAVAAYNAKQARPDRQIKSYYNDICKDSKKHPVYEMIIGIYGKHEDGSPICSAGQGKKIMQQFVENWKERNPNLILIGAYYHADEPAAEPHVHLDYIPLAHGYTRGLETQTGLVKALGEQGIEKIGKATAQIQWEKRENDYLTGLCEAVGLHVEHPKQEGRQHLHTEEMKLQTTIQALQGTLKAKNKSIAIAEKKLSLLNAELSESELQQIDVTPKKFTGGYKGLSPEQAQKLVNTANSAETAWAKNKELTRKIKTIALERDQALEKVQKAEEQVRNTRSSVTREYAAQLSEAHNQNRILKKALNIPDVANYDDIRRKLKQLGLLQQKQQKER